MGDGFDFAGWKRQFRWLNKALDVADNLTNAEQQQMRQALKAAKRALKKEEIARKIFNGCEDTALFSDNSFPGIDEMFPRTEEKSKNYWKLRDAFDKA